MRLVLITKEKKVVVRYYRVCRQVHHLLEKFSNHYIEEEYHGKTENKRDRQTQR